jgi:hypothetical protein
MQPGADLQLSMCVFFHWNILYAEIPDEERRDLPERSYEPALDLLAGHPRITAAIELSGATLKYLEQWYPRIIGKLINLSGRGQVELLGSTWCSPFCWMSGKNTLHSTCACI